MSITNSPIANPININPAIFTGRIAAMYKCQNQSNRTDDSRQDGTRCRHFADQPVNCNQHQNEHHLGRQSIWKISSAADILISTTCAPAVLSGLPLTIRPLS